MNSQLNNTSNSVASAKHDMVGNSKFSNASSEFKNFIADIEDLMAQTTSVTGADLIKVKEQLNQRIGQAKQTMDKLGDSIIHRARKGAEVTNTYVHDQPWIAIGASAAIGLTLGFLLSRTGRKAA